MEKYHGLEGREKLINELTEQYSTKSASSLVYIQAGNGQGKTYIVNKLISTLSNSNLKILSNYEDELQSGNSHNILKNVNAIGFSGGIPVASAGLSIGWKSPSSQYEKIRNMLSQVLKSNVLLCVDDIDDVPNELRLLVFSIIHNLQRLEKNYNKRIFILITSTQDIYQESILQYDISIQTIKLAQYEEKDIEKFFGIEKKILDIDIHKVYSLCNGNLKLANFLYDEMAIQNNEYLDTLNNIITRKLAIIKEQGIKKELNAQDMEDIIYSASLSIKKFSAQFLKNIIEKNVLLVTNGLAIACDENLLEKDFRKYYAFILDEVQNYIAKMAAEKRDELFISYYNYYAQNEPDEYYARGYYIYKYQTRLGNLSEALFVLAYSFARKISDELKVKEIENIFSSKDVDEKRKNRFRKVKKFYDNICGGAEVAVITSDYDKLQDETMDPVVFAEISCEYFEYLYRKTPMDSPESSRILSKCIEYAKNELVLDISEVDGLISIDETILRLKIIYDIAPCVLDQRNDYEMFQKLYDMSKSLGENNKSSRQKSVGEYVENVFNRKAFLFVNQAVCDIYYEKAKKYFSQNEIWIEYYITMVCQAGTYIVIQEFEKAISICEKVKDECKMRDIELPQIEKLHNNEIIAEFLLNEQKAKSTKGAEKAAKKAITKLKKLINKKANATQYVIYTNICSLCLYIDDKEQYIKYKQKLEKIYGCDNIANVSNESIDDFYRYYFAWFELYSAIRDEKWEMAEQIALSLNGFVPALFRKQEIFWERKIDAVKTLIANKEQKNAYEFCHNLVQTKRQEQILSKFFYRGLMVSDIQYTSYF